MNDTYGHEAGDVMWAVFADFPQSRVRKEDVPAGTVEKSSGRFYREHLSRTPWRGRRRTGDGRSGR